MSGAPGTPPDAIPAMAACTGAAHAEATAAFLRSGHPGPVFGAAARAARDGRGVLAFVVETDGSTYAPAGTPVLFDGDRRTGWLSGGCLEAEVRRHAEACASTGALGWVELDMRDDAALFVGGAPGCRGCLRIALLPLGLLPGLAPLLERWREGGIALQVRLDGTGGIGFAAGDDGFAARLPMSRPADAAWPVPLDRWSLAIPRPPEAVLFGTGPEAPPLLRMLGELGWRTTAVESRASWQDFGATATVRRDAPAPAASTAFDAALVMHHDFERDLMALQRLARWPPGFIGLLGPRRRRDDLLRLLEPSQREALAGVLHAPVGLDIGGHGPEAIALGIAAQLQAWRAGRAAG